MSSATGVFGTHPGVVDTTAGPLDITPGVLDTPPRVLGTTPVVLGSIAGVVGTSSPASPPPWMTKCSTMKVLVKPPASLRAQTIPVPGRLLVEHDVARDSHLVSAWVVEPVHLVTFLVAQEQHRCAPVLQLGEDRLRLPDVVDAVSR